MARTQQVSCQPTGLGKTANSNGWNTMCYVSVTTRMKSRRTQPPATSRRSTLKRVSTSQVTL